MQRMPVTSSNIKEVGYENGVLEIQFRKGKQDIYQVSPVTPEEHVEFLNAHSLGKHFHNVLRRDINKVIKKIVEPINED